MSVYYPYFRGKQYELLTIRESAAAFKEAQFTPIIEPVKESLNGLKRTLDALEQEGVEYILIVNPTLGDHAFGSDNIHSFIGKDLCEHKNATLGILLSDETSIDDISNICSKYTDKNITLIHSGFTDAKNLVSKIDNINNMRHVFLEECCGKLYRKYFADYNGKVLLRDGFQRRINRKHPELEFFSDLHETFEMEGANGFGDFLIVGNDYSETGGPAYAVAIHITFIDPDKDNAMYIYHFVSDTQQTPKNPAGKFAEALEKLINEVNDPNSKIYKTEAIQEFIKLHDKQHFPGLGYVKKLSMKHHIETMKKYFELTNNE